MNQVELFVKFITKKNGLNRRKDVLRKQDKKEQRRSQKPGLHALKHWLLKAKANLTCSY